MYGRIKETQKTQNAKSFFLKKKEKTGAVVFQEAEQTN